MLGDVTFSVRVLYFRQDKARPRTGEQVTVFRSREHANGGSLSGTTDHQGVAHFECDWQVGGWDVPITVLVAGMKGAEFLINEGDQVTVVYDD